MKICLVTGGSRGIGSAVVEKFAKSGYSVILNYNKSEQQAQELQRNLSAQGCDVHLYRADVANVAEVKDMFDWVAKYFKHIDVLVNNAGVWRGGVIQDVTEADYDFVTNVNAKGTWACCKYGLPLLLRSERASIVNVSSIWGLQGSACESVYSMSKFAIVGLTQSLAKELANTSVAVSCICPPIVKTDMCSCYSQTEIDDFCAENGLHAYTPDQVAESIYNLATTPNNGVVLKL